MSKTERAIVSAALALVRAGRGFIFRGDGMIKHQAEARVLESACADHINAMKVKKKEGKT